MIQHPLDPSLGSQDSFSSQKLACLLEETSRSAIQSRALVALAPLVAATVETAEVSATVGKVTDTTVRKTIATVLPKTIATVPPLGPNATNVDTKEIV